MLVSVVMPILNAGPWLAEAIASILVQTHDELELILVDDWSSDDSREIAASAARTDRRVRTLFLDPAPHLTSSSRATNAGNALARGRYIARLDADDIALPERLERQLEALESRDLDACGTQAVGFGDRETSFRFAETDGAIKTELIFRVGMLHPTLFARAELIHAYPFLESASFEDYEWQVRIAAAGARLGNLRDTLLRRRLHPLQANIRHGGLFMRDQRQYRFRYVMSRLPGLALGDYQILAAVAERAVLADRDHIGRAGEWLVRLLEPGDEEHRCLLARRWQQLCDRSGLAAADPLRKRYEGALGSRPPPST